MLCLFLESFIFYFNCSSGLIVLSLLEAFSIMSDCFLFTLKVFDL